MFGIDDALGIVGGALSIYGQIKQANAQQKAADYNAKVADQNATAVKQKEIQDERSLLIGSEKQIGAQRAGYGSSGVASDSGSAFDVLAESAVTAQRDVFNLRASAEAQSNSYTEQAKMTRETGQSIGTNAVLGELGTGITAAAGILRRK